MQTVYEAVESYYQTFGSSDPVAQNFFESALFTAAQNTSAEREKALVEFYETRGAANVSVKSIKINR